jgi:hypothetical protein
MSEIQYVLSDATVTESGSAIFAALEGRYVVLVVNVKGTPSGTSPTLTFSVSEIDPGDRSTVVGATITGTVITATGTQILKIPVTLTGCVLVTWTIGGSSPSFSQTYATLLTRSTTVLSGLQADGTETPGTIKGASTAAQVSDPALVVALSPNSPLPIGVVPTFHQDFAVTSGVIKGSPGDLFSFIGDNLSTTGVLFLQFFNLISVPSNGATPFAEFPVGTTGNVKHLVIGRDFFSQSGLHFPTGICYGWSSTSGTYTAYTGTPSNNLGVTYD